MSFYVSRNRPVPEPSLDPSEPKPYRGTVTCPNCGEQTHVDVDFSEQDCEWCGEPFEWDGVDEWEDEQAEREEYYDRKLHAQRDGD